MQVFFGIMIIVLLVLLAYTYLEPKGNGSDSFEEAEEVDKEPAKENDEELLEDDDEAQSLADELIAEAFKAKTGTATDVKSMEGKEALLAEIPEKDRNRRGTSWVYSQKNSQMTDLTTYVASINPLNEVQLEHPYHGGTLLTLTIKENADQLELLLSIPNGLFGRMGNHSIVNIRFDNNQTKSYSFDLGTNASLTEMRLGKAELLIQKMRLASSMRIEVPYFSQPPKVSTFYIKGLQWPPAGSGLVRWDMI